MQDVIDFNLLKEYDTSLKDVLEVWTKQKVYSLGDKVKYKGHLLECTTAGTSGTTTLNFTGLDVGDTINDGTVVWELVEESSGKGIDFYTVGESYDVGDIVIYSGNIYQCIIAHTATSTFDNAKWEEVSKSGIPYYNQDTSYEVDDQVVYNNKIYKCVTAHTSTSTFDSTKWEELSSGGGISIWQANTAYEVNDIVIDSNLIWQCATAHTSTSIFDESKWVCISGGEISNGMEIVSLWEGSFSFSNSVQGATLTSSTPMIELSESINNFECLMLTFGLPGSDSSSCIVNVSDAVNFTVWARLDIMGATSTYTSCGVAPYDSTHLYIKDTMSVGWPAGVITKVQGIRKAKPIVSSGMKYETLWEGSVGSLNSSSSGLTLNLNDSIKKYKKIGFQLVAGDYGEPRYYYNELTVDELLYFMQSSESSKYATFTWNGTTNDYFTLNSSTTDTQLAYGYKNNKLIKVLGISEGVQIPTGVQAARVTLWEGLYNTSNESATSFPNTIQLNDIISNYDQFEVTLYARYGDTGESSCATQVFNTSDIIFGVPCFRINSGIFVTDGLGVSYSLTFPDNSHFAIAWQNINSWGYNPQITKIVGIKYIQPDSYSTEEKLIGTWIDGKPLYRKVFGNSSLSLSTGLSSDSYKITRLSGFCNFGGNYVNIPYNYSGLYIVQYMSVSSGIITTASSNPSEISDYTIIVEYTKN